ncbi:MAG TPA: GNAT family N-acetyltransferase [Candidatus Limnocylindrales bacterium]
MTTTVATARSTVEIRGARTDDFDGMARVFAACSAVDGYDTIRSGDQLRDGITGFPGIVLDEQVHVATAGDQLVGYAFGAVNGQDGADGRTLWHEGQVMPEWRGRGIGRRLLAAAQEAARRHGDRRFGSASGGSHFRTSVAEHAEPARLLLEHDGYAVVRYIVAMVRPSLDQPPSPELPAGLEARPATPETAIQILRAADEAFQDHWGAHEETDADFQAMTDHPLAGQLDVWQVAWDGNEVAGGVLGFINDEENRALGRRRGYTEGIFTRRPWRGRGVATALIGRNLRLLAERGMTEAALTVDAENLTGALGLYRRVGFEPRRTNLVFERQA